MNPLQKILEYPIRERYTDGTYMARADQKLFARLSLVIVVLALLMLVALVTLI